MAVWQYSRTFGKEKEMAKKEKYYVVWDGASCGVFSSWEACQEAVEGYSNARYKSFKSMEEAEDAYEMGADAYYEMEKERATSDGDKVASDAEQASSGAGQTTKKTTSAPSSAPCEEAKAPQSLRWAGCKGVIMDSIAVDAACSGNPGMMEYRGVYLGNGREIFHFGPMYGTNNIGEFLALVHGLALLKQKGLTQMPIYSDSVNAQLWVRQRHCKTTLVRNEKTAELYRLIERAEKWLRENSYCNPVIKWPTESWGEIPADFGRK